MNENLSRKCFAADIGATNCRLAIVDENDRILRTERIKTPQENPVETIKEKVKDFVDGEKLAGLAFSIAGPVDGESSSFTNLPGQPKIHCNDFKGINHEVVFLNDGVAAVYAEHFKDPEKDIVFITISSGIGGAVIKNGKLIRFKDTDEEIGHIEIANSDYHLSCGCKPGKFNHWEAFCSGNNLVCFFNAWKSNEKIDSDFKPKEAKDIFAAANQGDEAAGKFLKSGFGRINKIAVEKVIAKYHPEKIVFGGSAAINNQKEVLDGIKDIPNLPEITFTTYGDDVSLIGTAKYLFNTQ